MPLERRTLATAAASTDSSTSTVPTTWLRAAGSATKGVVHEVASAQRYSRDDESAVRPVAQASPPCPFSHSTWFASMARVATAGVLYVWSLRELSIAVVRSRKSGIQRPPLLMSSILARAAGESSASHR